jgi:Subtilase family
MLMDASFRLRGAGGLVPIPLRSEISRKFSFRSLAVYNLLPILAVLAMGLLAPSTWAQGVSIDGVSPKSARHGETVAINGRGFGALNISVTVSGVPVVLLAADGNQASFRIPDTAKPGATVITATNPGGQTGSIPFRVLEGILLPGLPSGPALAATFDMPPVSVDQSLIQHGIFLTRLAITFAPGATVDQINHALVSVEGGVVSMAKGLPFVTIGVPQATLPSLDAILQTLRQAPGILFAALGRALVSDVLPVDPPSFRDNQLLPTRFPAAWNAGLLALRNCATQPKLTVLVADDFQTKNTLPDRFSGFDTQIPGFHVLPADDKGGLTAHGYDVTTTIAALFDANAPTGANPFTPCLDVTGIQTAGLTLEDAILRVAKSFPPSGHFILNNSQGFGPACCVLENPFQDRVLVGADDRARLGAIWQAATSDRWTEFLAVVSAGNMGDEAGFKPTPDIPAIYPGYRLARYNNEVAVSTDTTAYGFITDTSLWKPTDSTLRDLTGTSLTSIQLVLLQIPVAADNVLITGSTDSGNTIVDLKQSGFSSKGADVAAVGDVVPTSGGFVEVGTSFSAPQVAGLASYLWLLSNDLRTNHPAHDTRTAIQANARPRQGQTEPVIDAYATVLSLDQAGAAQTWTADTAPVRFAILNINNDAKFDENDLAMFLSHYLDANGLPVDPQVRDFSRFDLNGDGFTGGSHIDLFDFDRSSSKQYGATIYATDVTQQIEGKTIHFNSNTATDMQILCYYAYSPLYTGDKTVRANLMKGCAGVTVQVSPKTITLVPGGTQQFSATVLGSNDPRVNWSATGGTITSTGMFTAGTTAGNAFKVRATSVANLTAFDEATITINAQNGMSIVDIASGRTPGLIEASILPVGGLLISFSSPTSDVAGFMTKLNAALAGVTEIGELSVQLDESINFNWNLGLPVGDVQVFGKGCASNVSVTVGDVRPNPSVNQFTRGLAFLGGCLANLAVTVGDVLNQAQIGSQNSHIHLTAHNIGTTSNIGALFLGCTTIGCSKVVSSVVDIQAANIKFLSIANSSDSTITVKGKIQSQGVSTLLGVDLENNVNLTLGAPLTYADVDFVALHNNTFASPPQFSIGNEVSARDVRDLNFGIVSITGNTGLSLGGISMGSIAGDLTITDNHGFTDTDAHAFANSHGVAGAVTIHGNTVP